MAQPDIHDRTSPRTRTRRNADPVHVPSRGAGRSGVVPDQQERYVPDTVFLESASPVDVSELSGLKPSTLRPSKQKDQTARIDHVPAPAPKKKKKKPLRDPKSVAGPKALKKSFKSVFATVALTTGSLEGCLERSTNLSKAEIAQLAQHVDLATRLDQGEDGPDESFLEKILDSEWAERFVQNLLSFVLRNSTNPQGRPPASDKSKDAVAKAISTFNEFKNSLCPGFQALNSSDLALSNIIAELAPKMVLDVKMHYRRMPETLRTKLSKLSIDCDGLPEMDQDNTNAGGDAGASGGDAGAADVDEDVDDEDALKQSKKIVFKPGHIQLCWQYFLRIPSSKRPRFCTQAKMSDSFIDINEEALVALPWEEKSSQLDNVWEGTHFTYNWAAAEQRSSYGEVVKEQFIGDRDAIKEAKNKKQTTYGKRSTTMAELGARAVFDEENQFFPRKAQRLPHDLDTTIVIFNVIVIDGLCPPHLSNLALTATPSTTTSERMVSNYRFSLMTLQNPANLQVIKSFFQGSKISIPRDSILSMHLVTTKIRSLSSVLTLER
ncbi:MAG: hypothetical protein J3R72DRAFT_419838 [Linnemannia gamsii]|nr:MAG: hypothetical protein J3R72DRAFT_419838 [Linnemannia gamsii]